MKTNKTSKRALLTSVLSIALCLSMLIGTTFAWFTDTASTAVNKIQAGTLKVGLYKDAGCTETAEGQTLKFKSPAAPMRWRMSTLRMRATWRWTIPWSSLASAATLA